MMGYMGCCPIACSWRSGSFGGIYAQSWDSCPPEGRQVEKEKEEER